MKVLVALLRKELRNARGFLLLAVGLMGLLTLSAKLAFGADYDAALRFQWVTPLALAIVVIVLAADAVGRDAASGVEELWQRLPVDRALVWSAKLVAVVLGATAFHLAAWAIEACARAFEAPERTHALARVVSLPVIGFAGLAASLAATHLRRALPSALVGGGAVLACPFLLPKLAGTPALFVGLILDPWLARLPALFACALLGASLAAFRCGGWGFLGLRRMAHSCLVALLVLGPTLGWSAISARERARLLPRDPQAEILAVAPAPDGRAIAVQVARSLPLGGELRNVWLLDRDGGSWRALGEGTEMLCLASGSRGRVDAWTAEGRLGLCRHAPGGQRGESSYELYDTELGALVWSESGLTASAVQRAAMSRRPWLRRSFVGEEQIVVFEGQEARWPRSATLVPGVEPGIVFFPRTDRLIRRDLRQGVERTLATIANAEHASIDLSPDGAWIACRGGGELLVLDAEDGTPVLRESGAFLLDWCRLPGRIAFLRCGQRGAKPLAGTTELLFTDGYCRVLAPGGTWRYVEGHDGDFLRFSWRGRRLERRGIDGELLEVLLEGASP